MGGRRQDRQEAQDTRRIGRSAVLRFAISGLIAMTLLAWGVYRVVEHQVRDNAVAEAKAVTHLTGRGIIEPQLTPALLNGDPRAIARFDRMIRDRVLHEPIVRVKLWTDDARVIYSDEARLVGRRFPFKEDAASALRSGGTVAEVTTTGGAENAFERQTEKLVEVYVTLPAPGGRRVLYEAYLRYGAEAASGSDTWKSIAPIVLGGLILLWLVQVPMAAQMARRLRRGQEEREALLGSAIEASDLERRRIARDLHDGPVQRLASVSYGLRAASKRLENGERDGATELVDAAAESTRQTIRELRTMLIDLYPPTLQREGIAAALGDLLAPLRADGVEANLDVDPEVTLPTTDEALVYRVAQEALRNVAQHAGASKVDVQLARENGSNVLVVADDGRGFDDTVTSDSSRHFGLRMMSDNVHDLGGAFGVRSAPGRGTTIRLEIPR